MNSAVWQGELMLFQDSRVLIQAAVQGVRGLALSAVLGRVVFKLFKSLRCSAKKLLFSA